MRDLLSGLAQSAAHLTEDRVVPGRPRARACQSDISAVMTDKIDELICPHCGKPMHDTQHIDQAEIERLRAQIAGFETDWQARHRGVIEDNERLRAALLVYAEDYEGNELAREVLGLPPFERHKEC